MSIDTIWPLGPLIILSCGIMATLILGAFRKGSFALPLSLIAVIVCGIWAVPIPEVQEGFGLAATPFARFFTITFSLIAAITLLFSLGRRQNPYVCKEEYPATILFALLGMTVVVSAGNLLVLFLGIEALSFAFYFLVAIDRNSELSAEAGLKYLLLGAVSAAFISFGIALIYAGTGTLELVPAMRGCGGPGCDTLIIAGWAFILAGVGFKISLAPFHLWTPDVFQGAPTPVTALLATGSKGAAVSFLLLLLPQMRDPSLLAPPLWLLSLMSMVVGNLAALLQRNVKRMLGYSSVAHMGYLALALTAGTIDGYVAVAVYVVFYAMMNLAAFGALMVLEQLAGSEIDGFRGLGYQKPLEAAIFSIAMFALAGIPPTVGFIGKFAIFMAAIRGGETSLAVAGILTAAISAYFYLRVVVTLYMSGGENRADVGATPSLPHALALVAVTLCIIIFGIYPAPLLEAARIALL